MGSRTIISEFGTDTDSIGEASAAAIEPTMHAPHAAWRLNFIDHEQIERIIPSSPGRKRKAQQLAEDTTNQHKVHKKPPAAPKRAPKGKAACPKNTQAAQGYILMPKTMYHNGKDRLELCGFFTHDPGCKKHIISLKGCDHHTRDEIGRACRNRVPQGGATKKNVTELKGT